jgi:hypothetical protein
LPLRSGQLAKERLLAQAVGWHARRAVCDYFAITIDDISPKKQPITGIQLGEHAAIKPRQAIGKDRRTSHPPLSCQAHELIAAMSAATGKIPREFP